MCPAYQACPVLKSMTGFGSGEHQSEGMHVGVEIRSVNHRFCEVLVKMPRSYFQFEERIKELVTGRVARGHLEIYVNIEDRRQKKRSVKLDKDLLVAYYNCLREMAEYLHIDFQVGLYQLSQYPEVIRVEEEEEDLESAWPAVREALEQALEQLVLMREREGARLYADIAGRKEAISRHLEGIKARQPQLVEDLRERLRSRLLILLEGNEFDENRLAAEVVLYAERSSIAEEVVRLESHLEQLDKILNSDEPVGRRMDFLIQEMNREINTIGSKAADLVISPLVIEVKSELEKMREQAQNVE